MDDHICVPLVSQKIVAGKSPSISFSYLKWHCHFNKFFLKVCNDFKRMVLANMCWRQILAFAISRCPFLNFGQSLSHFRTPSYSVHSSQLSPVQNSAELPHTWNSYSKVQNFLFSCLNFEEVLQYGTGRQVIDEQLWRYSNSIFVFSRTKILCTTKIEPPLEKKGQEQILCDFLLN